MDEAAVLQVNHLVTDRGRAHILRDVSLAVRPDEVVCLVGRNGAGKTTTMDSLMGLLPVRGGTIQLRGQDITRLPAHARALRGIGYAPEDAGVFPDLTVDENLDIAQWLGTGGRRPANGDDADSQTARVFDLF
ncbi:MAG TPA: ATP-binding cassette domain-containing protein, partial [bacterium]|nr:ATP-binding cassette domain-containing protein [bacterium]